MMTLTRHSDPSRLLAQMDGPVLVVGEQRFTLGLVTIIDGTVSQQAAVDTSKLMTDVPARLTSGQAQVLLLGTGLAHVPLPALAIANAAAAGIGIESMSTAAACRTWNVLVSEDRAVNAAFLIEC